MKNFNKNIIAVLLMATVLSGCGNSPEMPTEQASTPEVETEAETKVETEATAPDYSEAKAKIEALQKKIEDYSDPVYVEKKDGRATIIMTEYRKDRKYETGWEYYAINEEEKTCFGGIVYTDSTLSTRCSAAPDGNTIHYVYSHVNYGTYTFYAIYEDIFNGIYCYKESEPMVIDDSTVIDDPYFDEGFITKSYFFNSSNLVGDSLYETKVDAIDKKLAEGEITEEEYYQRKTKIMDMYKN